MVNGPPGTIVWKAMKRPSRTTLVTTLGVVAALAVLLVAGRLARHGLPRLDGAATSVTAGEAGPQLPVVLRAAVSDPVDGVAVAEDGGVWIVHRSALSRVDPQTLRITATPVTQWPVTAVAAGAGAIWASARERLLRVDPPTARVTAWLPVATGAAPVAGWGGLADRP